MAKKNSNRFLFHRELARQLVTLSISALGLAAALAWNETIQQTVKEFITQRVTRSVAM